MKHKSGIIFMLTAIFAFLIACETHKDPFSAANEAPEIRAFSFTGDSLKFTRKAPFDVTHLNLKYADSEKQRLTAIFKFLSGSGRIVHGLFKAMTLEKNSATFEIPSEFDSESSGRLIFIPDTTGLVEIELILSDGVKEARRTATAFFFKNLDPLANFTTRLQSNVAPYQVEVDASGSRDRDAGQVQWYHWSFGDGSGVTRTRSKIFQHSYSQAGTYTITLKVEDDEGGTDSTQQVISTNNQAPLAVLQVSPLSGKAPLTVNYTATNSTDPDGQVVSYRVDFGDGASTLESAGTHTYSNDSNYRIKLTVQDNLGRSDTASVRVVVSTPPSAVLALQPTHGVFPLDVDIDATGSFDPQGGELAHDIYINGQLTYKNTARVTHTFSEPGDYQVRLLVTSLRNNKTAEVNGFVQVRNDNPVANFSWTPAVPQHMTPVTYTSTSFDPNLTDEISYYRWTFPMGVVIEGENEPIVIRPFDAGVDTFKVKLEVWDKFRGTPFEGYHSVTKIVPKN